MEPRIYLTRPRSLALRVFQVTTIVSTILFFTVATIVAILSPHRPRHNRNLRNAQYGLTSLAVLSATAEAVIDAKRSNPFAVADPDLVYSLFLTLIWTILLLGLVDTVGAASYPHYGAWIILLVGQGVVFALSLTGTSLRDDFGLEHCVSQGIQIAVTAGLLAAGMFVEFIQRKDAVGTEDERQPLLAAEVQANKPNHDAKAKEPDEEELDRQRIRSRPGWQYLSSFKVFVPYMFPRSRQQRSYLLGMCISSALTRIATAVLPLTLGAVINGLGDAVPWKAIVLYATLKFLVSQAGFSLIESWLANRVTTDLVVALNRRSYDHIMNLSADFHDSKRSSVIWSTMHQGHDVIDLLHECVFVFLPTIIDLASAAVVLTYLFGLYMTFIIAATVVFFYWLTFRALYKKRSLRRSWLDAFHDEYYQMSESTSNWSTVSQFGRVRYEMQRFREKGDITRSTVLLYWFYDSWTRGLRHIVPSLSFLAACGVAALQIAHGQHKIGVFVVLITYWAQLTGPLGTLASELSRITHKLVNAEKLLVLLEKVPRTQDAPNAQTFRFIEGAVDFENVSFSYDNKRQVTHNITFRAAPGKTVAFVGQTGGGKSTILKLLFRFYDVDQGRILIDGQDIRQVKMEGFRKHIAMVPQNPVVFNMSVLENVKYPDSDCTDEEVMEACKAAALHDKIISFTHGYQEKVGERGTKLSGGELQRLAIARAILKKADILLLDEATSSVDSITEKQIQASIRKLCAGKTAFVIAHRLSTILHADHILVVHGGQIVEFGTHETLIKQKGSYNELWRSQLQFQAHEHTGSRSRSPRKEDAPVLINDMSTSGEDSQALVKSTSRGCNAYDQDQKEQVSTSESASIPSSGHRSHQASHAATKERGRVNVKRLARALNRRLSQSRSPEKGVHNGQASPTNPVLKPDAPEFVPRRFQGGDQTTMTSGDETSALVENRPVNPINDSSTPGKSASASKKENDVKNSDVKNYNNPTHSIPGVRPSVVFPLKRKWMEHSRESLDANGDMSVHKTEEQHAQADVANAESDHPGSGKEQSRIRTLLENARRRQTASEPFPQNDGVDDSGSSSEDGSILQSTRFSRLPQPSPRRAASAVERSAGQSSGEEVLDSGEGSKAPVNTAATSPGVLSPTSNLKVPANSPAPEDEGEPAVSW